MRLENITNDGEAIHLVFSMSELEMLYTLLAELYNNHEMNDKQFKLFKQLGEIMNK